MRQVNSSDLKADSNSLLYKGHYIFINYNHDIDEMEYKVADTELGTVKCTYGLDLAFEEIDKITKE